MDRSGPISLIFGVLIVALALTPVAKASRPLAASGHSWAGQLAFIGADGNIYTCAAGCDQPRCVTCHGKSRSVRAGGLLPAAQGGPMPPAMERQYDLPTFSPDGKRLAYTSTMIGRQVTNGLHVFDLASGSSLDLLSGPTGRPIYLAWTPGGHQLFFLLSHAGSLKLMLADADHPAPARVIATGQPLFFDWNQELHDLVLNYAPDEDSPAKVALMRISTDSQEIVRVLSDHPASFRAPAWSPDKSHLAWAIDNGRGQAVLVVAKADGNTPQQMAALPPRLVSFVWAPDSRHIAFSAASRAGNTYDGISMLDIASGTIDSLVTAPVLAYSFSPNSQYLAYVAPGAAGYSWNLIRLPNGKPRHLFTFAVTNQQALDFRFFDQFALSLTSWSPDSRALTFAGTLLPGGRPVPPSNAMPPPMIWVAPIENGQPQAIADGSMSFFSPAPER